MKTTLYLGTDPTQFEAQGRVRGHLIHYPVIKIVPRTDLKLDQLEEVTHFIFTSKNAVKIFFQHLTSTEVLKTKTLIAIGKVTAAHLNMRNFPPHHIAQDETQEGVVQLLRGLPLENSYIFLPRSSISRPILVQFFEERGIRYLACDLYETVPQMPSPKPDLDLVDEIIFTSPSTVQAFLKIFGSLPKNKKLIAIGPVTQAALNAS